MDGLAPADAAAWGEGGRRGTRAEQQRTALWTVRGRWAVGGEVVGASRPLLVSLLLGISRSHVPRLLLMDGLNQCLPL
jgi:hypothetical protein